MMNRLKITLQHFHHDQSGQVLDVTMVAALISVPLIMFQIVYGQNVVQWVKTKSPNMMAEEVHWVD